MIQANDDNFDRVVLASPRTVIVDFGATWCPPCKAQKPILASFAEKNPGVEVVYVDVDESPRVASRLGVQGVPTLMVFVGGQRKTVGRGLQSPGRIAAMIADAGG